LRRASTSRSAARSWRLPAICLSRLPARRRSVTSIRELLDARIVRPAARTEQHLCLDKGYDYVVVERAVRQRRFQPHIRRRGEEPRACRRGTRARRWVVERTHSWFNRYRKLLIRWEKKPQNYLALVQFAAVLIVWRLVG
jgi:putative transposase